MKKSYFDNESIKMVNAYFVKSNLLNGGNPQRRMYVITPAAQISTLRPYLQTKKITLIATINNNNNNKFLALE